MDKKRVAVVGAGLSGLIAAKHLSKKMFDVTVFEKENRPGGRMLTDVIDGWELDRGFQVLLTGYPYLKKNIDFADLDLVYLDSGATIIKDTGSQLIGDPLRDLKLLFPTLFASAASIKDKLLIVKLRNEVKRKSIDELFEVANQSTADFLKEYGFSFRVVENFFKPFYAGIFLEDELKTSSRMFLFVFKMFAEGRAAIPKGGIGKLAQEIADHLTDVNFKFNTEILEIKDKKVFFKSSEAQFDLIINTSPSFNAERKLKWKNSHVFYVEHSGSPIIDAPRIGLIAEPNRLINNIFYPNVTQTNPPSGRHLLSLTVVNDRGMSAEQLKEAVLNECKALVQKEVKFVHHYAIPKSLPDIDAPRNQVELNAKDQVMHIGDYLLNGSQNAACKIGEEVAAMLNGMGS
jgi:protoporphyrinogen oxidase